MNTNIGYNQTSTTFVVDDGLNTSYIDSVLIALFYHATHLHEMLLEYPKKSKFIYLQELINNNFIDQTRHIFSVDSSIMNEIRNYSIICGWKELCYITDLFNSVDYLSFLMDGFNFGNIKMEIIEVCESGETMKTLNMNYVNFKINENNTIEHLLNEWIESVTKKTKISSLLYYQFNELPQMIPIYLNRNEECGRLNTSQIDIFNRIKFKKNNNKTQNSAYWIIHSIICFSNSGGGHYYSIINLGKKSWYLFSSSNIPSLIKIKISDPDTSTKIKQECVLLLYRLNDELCKY